MTYNGGSPTPACFDIPGRGGSVVNRLLSYEDDYPGNIRNVGAGARAALPQGVYPFANDPAGNYLCFDYRTCMEGEPVIVFCDHEALDEDNPDASLSYVCQSFSVLMNSLYDCEEVDGSA